MEVVQHDDFRLFPCLLLEESEEQLSILLCLADFFCLKKKKSLFMEGEDMAEKTLVHKTAVKRISTH